MPELPEVETVRRGLAPFLAGRRIGQVEVRRPGLRFPFPDRFADRLEGRTVHALGRRAKYLLAHLSSGEVLVMHLGMSGRFTFAKAAAGRPASIGAHAHDFGRDPRHDHVVLTLEDGASVIYNDPRRFGCMLLVPETALGQHPLLAGLGVEPLGDDLDPSYLAARARGRKVDLKAFLMDQRIIAGLGNIYACEALHRAGLSPSRAATSLATAAGGPTRRGARLIAAVKSMLEGAILAGGSTLRDYRRTDGSAGAFQNTFRVYGREGEPCLTPGCRGIVQRSVQGGRSTYHCGACQR